MCKKCQSFSFIILLQNNVSSCLKSCEFLTLVQNFSSILNGDGSTPPTPTIPTVTSTNFTSISLKWDPVRNTSGSAVYLIQVTFTGEQSRFSPRYLSEVNRPEYVLLLYDACITFSSVFLLTGLFFRVFLSF